MLKLWQELQEMNPDLDKRGSKKSILPNSTMSGFFGLAATIGLIGSSPANAVTGDEMDPIYNNDTINARITICHLPKKQSICGTVGCKHKLPLKTGTMHHA
jgi:hypothetical protein